MRSTVKRVSSRLHLVVPGLLESLPAAAELATQPEVPLLETLLSRADPLRVTHKGLEATLFDLYGLDLAPGRDLPSGACARLGDGGTPDQAFWLHADPVFFRPDGDRLLLFDAEVLDIQADEAEELSVLFNSHFASEGWHLEALAADRWYLRLPSTPALVTQPLSEAIGRNIDHFLPGGPDGARWRTLLNEVQMLFHASEVNARRESMGRLPINGLWFSGGGCLPDLGGSPIRGVMADHPLARGLALRAKASLLPLPEKPALADSLEGDWILLCTQALHPVLYADAPAWSQAMGEIEGWVRWLCGELRRGRLQELVVHPCNGGQYRQDARRLRRFWLRRRPLKAFVQ